MDEQIKNDQKIELHISPQIVMENDDIDLFAYANKRDKVIWTAEEVDVLTKGIKKFGKGRWKEILNSFKDDLSPLRRMKDLSDKVRVLEHETTYRRRTKRDHWEVDANHKPICKMGEKVIYRTKLPFEAAVKCAYTKNYSPGSSITINIAYEEAGKTWIHIYNAKYVTSEKSRNRIKVRKMGGQSPYRKDGM